LALVIPRPRFATTKGGFLAITLRDGAVNRHCRLGRRAKGTTLGCAFVIALAVHHRRPSDRIRVNRPEHNPIRDSPRVTPELARHPRGFDIDNDKRIAEADRAAA